MSIIITVGKLVSTSDLKLAKKLNKIVKLEDITRGQTPASLVQNSQAISFMINGDFYELEAAK